MRTAKLLHTADVHLGNGSVEQRAFESAIDLAIEVEVDAIVIAGDLFDHPRVSDELLVWTAKELDRAERPIVLLVGNHDTLHDASVHHRFQVTERCAQVALLDDSEGSVVEVAGTDVVVWGRAMVEHLPSFRPLAGVPPKPDDRWGIIAAHGLVRADDRPTHHSSPIFASELAQVDWDYVALGHQHGYEIVQEQPCPVVYPGYPARSRQGAPGAVVVDLSPDAGVTFRWAPLQLGSDNPQGSS